MATYDASDPIHVLQVSIEDSWNVAGITKPYYAGKSSQFGSPATAPEDIDEYCILDFGDASKQYRTNISVIWSVPVTIKVFGISEEQLRTKVTSLKSFLGAGEVALADAGLAITDGNLSEVVCNRVSYEKIAATKAKAEFEIVFRLVLPIL